MNTKSNNHISRHRKYLGISLVVFLSSIIPSYSMQLQNEKKQKKATISQEALTFFKAIERGDTGIVDLGLTISPDSINFTGPEGRKPIHYAAIYNQLDILKLLIGKQFPSTIRAINDHGEQAIHYATSYGHIDIVKALLSTDPTLASAKINSGSEMQPIHLAAKKGRLEILNTLLEIDANLIRAKDKYGVQPIHYAAAYGNVNIMETLFEKDPKVLDYKDYSGSKAIDFAKKRGQDKSIEFIMDKKTSEEPNLYFILTENIANLDENPIEKIAKLYDNLIEEADREDLIEREKEKAAEIAEIEVQLTGNKRSYKDEIKTK